ncbi:hypothetical protein KBX53_10460 [Micromonospora sp. M51]|uniref:hypothetical protein n=1 Tax=Micromonospora TaxID=1873 RepID=UPI0004BE67A4|nr:MULTISPECIES: hypothetical protein [Micromonospora]MBQ1011360.1 hypothetical protein [Micromonospora sp. M51]MBQ1032682.1 hypothetical protein [Micromonospora sp. C97]
MAIPDLLPIAHEPDYRASTIGHYDKGQFFGSVTATLTDGAGAEAARHPTATATRPCPGLRVSASAKLV